MATAAVSGAIWITARLAFTGTQVVAFPTFIGFCNRIKAAGLPFIPSDQVCLPEFWHRWQLNYSATTLLVVAGACLTGVFLAATGRKLTAFLPLVPVLLWKASFVFVSHLDQWLDQWPGGLGPHLLGTALVLVPVLVAVICFRNRDPRRNSLGRKRGLQAAGLLVVATAILWAFLRYVAARPLGIGWDWVGGDWWATIACVAIFAALLGTDRRFWPWTLAVVAILLSWGPTFALGTWIESPSLPPSTLFMGVATPLFLLGLIWSGWGPLQCRLERIPASIGTRPQRRFRPVVALNALAVGLIIVAVIAARNDPFAIIESQPMPSYSGERTAVDDVVARRNLWDGLRAMNEYRKRSGTYAGFTVTQGRSLAPDIAWVDPRILPFYLHSGSLFNPVPIPGLVPVTAGHVARLVERSDGRYWCIQERRGKVTFGRSDPGMGDAAAFASAQSNCGDRPWTTQALVAPPLPDITYGYSPVARMIYVLMFNELHNAESPTDYLYFFERGTIRVPVGWEVKEQKTNGSPRVQISTGNGHSLLSATIVRRPGPYRPRFCGTWLSDSPLPDLGTLHGTDASLRMPFTISGIPYVVRIYAGRDVDYPTRTQMEQVIQSFAPLRCPSLSAPPPTAQPSP